jgi:hypothetical protein
MTLLGLPHELKLRFSCFTPNAGMLNVQNMQVIERRFDSLEAMICAV